MQIWEDRGRMATDSILLQSIYSYAAGMSMTDAANLFIQADSLLNGGINYNVIYQRFNARGILPPGTCTVGIDEPTLPASLSLFPNPTSGKFKVSLDAKALQTSSIR